MHLSCPSIPPLLIPSALLVSLAQNHAEALAQVREDGQHGIQEGMSKTL